jgi:multidrug efflux pump subunit AcrA (membrane-fusion protein)
MTETLTNQTELNIGATCHHAGAGLQSEASDSGHATLLGNLSAIGSAQSVDQLCQRLAPLLASTTVRFVVLCKPPPVPAGGIVIQSLYGWEAEASEWREEIAELCQETSDGRQSCLIEGKIGERLQFLKWPVPVSPGQDLVAACESSVSHTALFTLHSAAVQIASWQVSQEAQAHEKSARRLAVLAELVSRLETSRSIDEACRRLANEWQEYLGIQQVVVGRCHPGRSNCHVAAISGIDAFRRNSEEARTAEAALQESIIRGELSMWPPKDESSRFALKAHQRFARSAGVEAVVGHILRDERGEIQGAWLFAGSVEQLHNDAVLGLLCAAQVPVASTLGLLARVRTGWLARLSSSLTNLIRQHRGQAILFALMVAIAMLFVPVPHRVKCDCQLEPVTRRFVAAPFDGPLKEAFVRPGDLVTRGQLLARMDGREVRWELAGVQADLYRAAKERAGHVASHDAGAAVVAGHEVDRLQYREQLLKARDQELEIRSPVDGMVVSGDLEEAEGMPLQIGEVLFEVAPLDAMVVELAVPEDDFTFVQSGMPVRIAFDAFPLKSYEAKVDHVHPRAELRDEENVFIGELRLDNPHHTLHPGMRGYARVKVGKAPLGWLLFRRPAAAVVEWLGW